MFRFMHLEVNVTDLNGHLAIEGDDHDRVMEVANLLSSRQAKLGTCNGQQVLVMPIDLSTWSITELGEKLDRIDQMGMGENELEAAKAALKRELGRRVEVLQPEDLLSTIPECPICYTKLSTQIYACVNGHLVCDPCKARLPHCGVCREAFGGRATDTEQMIEKLTHHARI